MRIETLGIAFLISIAVHISAILVGAVIVHENRSRPQEFLFVHLIDAPRRQTPPVEKTHAAPPKLERPKAPSATARSAIVKPESARPIPVPPAREEPAKTVETKPAAPARLEPPGFASESPVEGGGSAAGMENLFGNSDVGVVPESGTAGGGGTAASGLGRGSGAPGLPAKSLLRTNRKAKPIQTARANYPPMALRAGIESDVTLKIEVDAQGNVTKAEITKSGGGGFDEEALRAVKQSRFEPAQSDGQNVAAEFTYVYRFRVKRQTD
ncbi:MAG: energy transducer TonB [Candidatus Binatia bacterium]